MEKSDGFLSIQEKRVLAGRSGRRLGAGAVFCSAHPGPLSVGTEWQGPVRADRGNPSGSVVRLHSQEYPQQKKKKREQILNHYTLLHSYVTLQRFNGEFSSVCGLGFRFFSGNVLDTVVQFTE